MIFGFDFDNTLINYDKVFYDLAVKKKLVNKNNRKNKESIKKTLFKKKKIKEWIELQSEVYSKGINKAKPNKVLISTLKFLKKKKIKFYVVSHKTKFPYYGEKINLHKISRKWLDENIFKKSHGLGKGNYYFEKTKKKKIERIKKLKISHFIDDLEEIIDLMPSTTNGILYKNKSFKINQIKKIIDKKQIIN